MATFSERVCVYRTGSNGQGPVTRTECFAQSKAFREVEAKAIFNKGYTCNVSEAVASNGPSNFFISLLTTCLGTYSEAYLKQRQAKNDAAQKEAAPTPVVMDKAWVKNLVNAVDNGLRVFSVHTPTAEMSVVLWDYFCDKGPLDAGFCSYYRPVMLQTIVPL